MSQIKSIVDYGADPTGKTSSTVAIQNCLLAIQKEGGGHLLIPTGHYITGSLQLCSNLVFEISAGATLCFIADTAEYPVITARWEGADTAVYQACLYGTHLRNLTIKGQGTIDGSGQYWWDRFNQQQLAYSRPYLISIEYSDNIVIQDVKVMNSPSWTIHPMASSRILIQNVLLENPSDSPNTDGINPESCQNVRIENCIFNVGDDCIAIKAGTEAAKEQRPCEDIIISNCTMNHGHGGVVIGSEMSGDIRRVLISNCIFNDTDRGIRMKTRRGRGGTISDIVVNDILMTNVICPIVINSYYFCGPGGQYSRVADKKALPVDSGTPFFKNIAISNITAHNTRACALFIYGLPEAPIDHLKLTNIEIDLAHDQQAPVAPAMFQDAIEMASEKMFLVNTTHTRIDNVRIDDDDRQLLFKEANNQALKLAIKDS